jgi:hypothetical protein
MIAASGDLLVTLVFTEFSTQPGKDLVRVFQCTDIGCSEQQLLAELSGTYTSAQALSSTTGYMKVVFTSDGSVNYDGFTATWMIVSWLSVYGDICSSFATAHAGQFACFVLIKSPTC